MNLTDVKLTDQVSRRKIDGHEIEGQDIQGGLKNGAIYCTLHNFTKY